MIACVASLRRHAAFLLLFARVAAPYAAGSPSQAEAAPEEPQYTGEIVSFDLVGSDIRDFFRVIAELTGLNVVLDDQVQGPLTLVLTDVPWDQALDVVLRTHGLGYALEGNVLWIAPQEVLAAAEAARAAFREAQESNVPLETRPFVLSYAAAADASAAIANANLLSVRGTIFEDVRRNALIVTDVPGQFSRIESLIAFLDTPQPQVEIEARLLSATRSFARELGGQLGMVVGNNGRNRLTGSPAAGSPVVRVPAPGVSVDGGLPLVADFPAAADSGFSFLLGAGGDVLLDAIISAAEAAGTAKLLSRPRVTTQNNQPATVSQGTQIPVQTNVNNTISVEFIAFDLSLTVTPQITEAGTILLTADIVNSSPDFARAVGGVPSVASQRAATQVLIPDGGTAVIGGILVDNDSVQIRRLPGLGRIPWIGNLFRSTSTVQSTSELLFFITARIKPSDAPEFGMDGIEEHSELFSGTLDAPELR